MIKRILIATLFILTALIVASIFQTPKQQNLSATIYEAFDNLTHPEFYFALANPAVSYVKIPEGVRKEQIASIVNDRFKWDSQDKKDFLAVAVTIEKKVEGKYFPDIYLVPKDISGGSLRDLMFGRFDNKTRLVRAEYKGKINFDTALTIASLIQREAAGKKDMKLISGIIWNRIFEGMSLQVDATLQYAKGNEQNGWWPQVKSADKNINSPYNTYQNKGLPPTPISNPGLAAIEAALNPQKTNCLFYIHKNRQIYCSATYEEHKKNIEKYLK